MSGERSATPVPLSDLSLSEYRSAPLRGTEARDRKGLGKQVFSTLPYDSTRNSVQFDPNSNAHDARRDTSHLPQRHDYNLRGPQISPPPQIVQRYPPRIPTVSHEQEPPLNNRAKSTGNIASAKISEGGFQHEGELTRNFESSLKEPGFSENEEKQMTFEVDEKVYDSKIQDHPNSQPEMRAKAHIEVHEKAPRVDEDKAKLNAAMSSLGNVWSQLVSTVRQTVDRVKVPVSPSASPDHESTGTYTSEYYTERDVTNLIHDIMQEIQMHQDEIRAHRDMLKDTGRWDSDHLTQREQDAGVIPPMLVMRKSTIVSPDILADAVTTSTKKLLLSKQTPVPWSVTSRLLMDVHSRLSEILEPLELAENANKVTRSPVDKSRELDVVSEYEPAQSTRNRKLDRPARQTMPTIQSEARPMNAGSIRNQGTTGEAIMS